MNDFFKAIGIAIIATGFGYLLNQGAPIEHKDSPQVAKRIYEKLVGKNPQSGTNWSEVKYEGKTIHQALASRDKSGIELLTIRVGIPGKEGGVYYDTNVDGILDRYEKTSSHVIKRNQDGSYETQEISSTIKFTQVFQPTYQNELANLAGLMGLNQTNKTNFYRKQ